MQAKFIEAKNQVNNIVNVPFKILSVRYQDELCLIEVEDGHHYVVNLQEKAIYSTKTLDTGVDFEGTNYVLKEKLEKIELKNYQYKRDVLMQKIMTILKINTTSGWTIVDSYGNLHLVHYTENANMAEVGHLRGILVDVEKERVLTFSFGYTPTVKADCLVYENDEMVLYDDLGQEHVFNPENTIIKKYSEGSILGIIKYDGQVLKITHKKIRPLKSRWGNSPYFTKIYKMAGGPTDSELFDDTMDYSPYCYVFLVVHSELLMASRQDVKSPYVVLLSINKMWSPEENDENVEQEQQYDIEPNDVGQSVTEPFVHKPKMLTLDEANNHLKHGFYPPCPEMIKDLRQTAGEAVILYKINDLGQVIDIVKVVSTGYDYRFKLRGTNEPNPYHRFYDLVPHSYHVLNDYVNYTEFKEKFIVFGNYSKEDLLGIHNHVGLILYLQEDEIPIEERKNRQYILKNIWLNYVLALPISMQKEAIEYLDKFNADRYGVMCWLQNYQYHNQYIDAKVVSERGLNIIIPARHTAGDICRQNPNKEYDDEVNQVIRNFILKEYGSSLYTLVKKWKNHKV